MIINLPFITFVNFWILPDKDSDLKALFKLLSMAPRFVLFLVFLRKSFLNNFEIVIFNGFFKYFYWVERDFFVQYLFFIYFCFLTLVRKHFSDLNNFIF